MSPGTSTDSQATTRHPDSAPASAGKPSRLWRDASLSAVPAGFVAVVVSYSGPLVIVLTAATAGGLSTAETGSWIWAISIGSGLTCIRASV
ncbi:benzoate/H(+) symporter BenE family transporter [Streptomyces sp. NPDC002867]